MDEIDRNLAVALQRDGSAGLAELAKVAGLSVSATAERVKRLEERGVIRGWYAALDPAEVGCPVLAHALLEVTPGPGEARLLASLVQEEAVLECHAVTGRWSHLLKLRVADLAALDVFLRDVLRARPEVRRVETLLCLSTAKETALLPVAPATEE